MSAGAATRPASREPDAADAAEFELMDDRPPDGLVRRFFTTQRHLLALLFGGLAAAVRSRKDDATRPRGLGYALMRVTAWVSTPFLDSKLAAKPFPVQFRKRLERLGPTYIKLGQILSLRDDLLPSEITSELKNLLDRLPVVSFDRLLAIVTDELGRPTDEMFSRIDPHPLGSASIAQIHRATTLDGAEVILKVVKPGISETLRRDSILLKMFGSLLQFPLGRFQPKRVISEFCDYTAREVDLRREADNAETFTANFKDSPDIVFPRIWRQYSSRSVLCMEFLDGLRPDDARVQSMTAEDKARLVDLGASSIIRMLYRDGFFHADLHPGNLMVLPGPRCGFIDLGMVGRFDEEVRRSMMYYYYCLVIGDAEFAARYLAAVAHPGPGADLHGFRRAVVEISRRWSKNSSFDEFSLAQLMLESVGIAAQYRVYFPVEMILMVKALVTFEGVGRILDPQIDVAEVSQRHISGIFIGQFSPFRIARESLRGAPEIFDAFVKAPLLITEGLRFLEKTTRGAPENPLAGLRGTIMAGCSLIAGAILVAFDGPWPIWSMLFVLALLLALRRGS